MTKKGSPRTKAQPLLKNRTTVNEAANKRQATFLMSLPVMHDATTTLKKHLEAGGKLHMPDVKGHGANALLDPVICERALIQNLVGDIQVLKLQQGNTEEMAKGFESMKTDIDEISVFLRERFAKEISLGYHGGRTLGVIVTGYLSQLLEYREKAQ